MTSVRPLPAQPISQEALLRPLPPAPASPPPPSPQSEPQPSSSSSRMPPPSPLVLQPHDPSPLDEAPTSPLSPLPPHSKEKKKQNPLVDLIDTEKIYVDSLAGIIRKVASAWSRDNLPPQELDTMFRAVEAVFRANRSLLAKLKEIGPNPASPKALGDLLMRWIDDLEAPYTRYCTTYTTSFDTWDPVQSNPNLPAVLEELSNNIDPPSGSDRWSLDLLFGLPRVRLKYYKKLYARLLKSTQAGRSDHKLLVGANEKLDDLLEIMDSRRGVRVGEPGERDDDGDGQHRQPDSKNTSQNPSRSASRNPSPDPSSRSGPLERSTSGSLASDSGTFRPPPFPTSEKERGSQGSSNSGSSGQLSRDAGEQDSRTSRDTAATSFSFTRPSSMTPSDVERRLATDRVLDIFTLTPKYCKLQMNPPNLPFKRTVRFSADCVVLFTPKAAGTEVVHRRAHIFLLTDLFLICEWMTPEEKANQPPDGPDMWLRYPPLAGKHLITSDAGPGRENAFHVQIMKKETIVVITESQAAKEAMVYEFKECADLAGNFGAPARGGSLPNGPASGLPRSSSAPIPNINGPQDASQMRDSASSQPSQSSSPRSSQTSAKTGIPPPLYIPPPRGASKGALVSPPARGASLGARDAIGQRSAPPSPGPPPRSPSLRDPNGPPQLPPPQLGMPLQNGMPPPNGRPPQGMPPPGMPPGMPPNGIGPGGLMPPQVMNGMPPRGPPFGQPMGGPPPHPQQLQDPRGPPNMLRRSPSGRSLASLASQHSGPPPHIPNIPPHQGGPPGRGFGGPHVQFPPSGPSFPPRGGPGGFGPPPSAYPARQPSNPRSPHAMNSMNSYADISPPTSPVDDERPRGPTSSVISAQMKCKVFLQQQHAQWKSLGGAKLKLYEEKPTNIKQLVVEADTKDHPIIISTIVLTDGVERVGKTGVAIELSDNGTRTGIIYMIQLKNETSAVGLFDSLLKGSNRARN